MRDETIDPRHPDQTVPPLALSHPLIRHNSSIPFSSSKFTACLLVTWMLLLQCCHDLNSISSQPTTDVFFYLNLCLFFPSPMYQLWWSGPNVYTYAILFHSAPARLTSDWQRHRQGKAFTFSLGMTSTVRFSDYEKLRLLTVVFRAIKPSQLDGREKKYILRIA